MGDIDHIKLDRLSIDNDRSMKFSMIDKIR